MDPHAFHHALIVDRELCTGCSHCMRVCPTEAIRVREGKACIDSDKCIDCGNCYRVCPAAAIRVEQDDLERLSDYLVKIALVPSVFIGQFPDEHSVESIYSALHTIGFDVVFEVENGVDVLQEKLNQYLWNHRKTKPLISSYCPAVIRLIQVKFPGLTDHIVQLKTPLDISADYCRKYFLDQGVSKQSIGVFYVTPCAAKIAAVKSPVGEEESALNGVINMDFLYNKVLQIIHQGGGTYQQVEVISPSKDGIRWSLTRGEASHVMGRALAVDGIRDVAVFLEKVEMGHAGVIDFLELRACKESCAAGILAPGNPFLTVENLDKRADERSKHCTIAMNPLLEYREYLFDSMAIDPVNPRPVFHLDHSVAGAIQRLEDLKLVQSELPGIDCGGCGAPSCRALAEDIVFNRGTRNQCPFYNMQEITAGTITVEEASRIQEGIWKQRIKKES